MSDYKKKPHDGPGEERSSREGSRSHSEDRAPRTPHRDRERSQDRPPRPHERARPGKDYSYTQREHSGRGRPDEATRRPRDSREGFRDDRRNDRNDRKGPPRDERTGQTRYDDEYLQQRSGATEALIELDKDLMKLLVRRATLVSRIRGGKEHASSPAAIQAEKAVRVAWETGALAFSKDPRFSRQLFSLLQDIKIMTREQARNLDSFNLAPPAKPLSGLITGPTSSRAAQMHAAISACIGSSLSLKGIMMSAGILDTVRAFAQAGSSIERTIGHSNLGDLTASSGPALSFADKSIFVGDDLFTLYLTIFLAIGKTGTCRLNGGGRLKGADLTPLRQTLPLLGARLAHVVPRSQGLPVNLESSGSIPPLVTVPGDLPYEAICALLLGPLVWGQAVTFNLSALPAALATAALAETGPLHKAFGADVEASGPSFVYTPGPLALSQYPSLPLDPTLCAYLLALPAFAGGEMGLKGRWPVHLPEAVDTAGLLSWAGLSFSVQGDCVTVTNTGKAFSVPLMINDLSPQLGPLFLALAALYVTRTGNSLSPVELASFPSDDADVQLATEFLSRLGLSLCDGVISPATDSQDEAPAWTSPDAYWSMSFALAAYLRPGVKLANPGNIAECMPPFWSIYNSLPTPTDPAAPVKKDKEESNDSRPARRRIIAD